MAMIKVLVDFQLTTDRQGSTETKRVETEVDESTYLKAGSDNGRKELESWAKNFFPTAVAVKVAHMYKK